MLGQLKHIGNISHGGFKLSLQNIRIYIYVAYIYICCVYIYICCVYNMLRIAGQSAGPIGLNFCVDTHGWPGVVIG